MKSFILILLMSIVCIPSAHAEKEYTIKGVLLQREWTKNLESYHAGGSTYYVLQSEYIWRIQDIGADGRPVYQSEFEDIILRPSKSVPEETLHQYVNQTVEVHGQYLKNKTQPIAEDDFSQHPLEVQSDPSNKLALKNPTQRTTIGGFEVQSIKVIKYHPKYLKGMPNKHRLIHQRK